MDYSLGFGRGWTPYFWPNTVSAEASKKTEEVHAKSLSLTPGEQLKDEQLKLEAFHTFDRFMEVWEVQKFWIRASTGDACLYFVEALVERWPKDPKIDAIRKEVDKLLGKNISYFKNDVDKTKMWADDFIWWGLYGLHAHNYLKSGNEAQKKLADEYLQLSTDLCWDYVYAIAYDKSEDAIPVAHGCRNNALNLLDGGVKNTVVNTGLLLLSTQLYRQKGLPKRDDYIEMAYGQWIWFSTWCDNKESGYLQPLVGVEDAALVQERPYLENSSYRDRTHPDWPLGGSWSGDQGFALGGLLALLEMEDDLAEYIKRTHPETKFDKKQFEEKVIGILNKVVRGILKALIGETDKIFHEAPCAASFSSYPYDYKVGLGVLIRYLVRYMNSKKVKELVGIDFTAYVEATVKALWDTRSKDNNQFQPTFTQPADDKAYVEQYDLRMNSSDQSTTWVMGTDSLDEGDCQGLGIDFYAVLLQLKNHSKVPRVF